MMVGPLGLGFTTPLRDWRVYCDSICGGSWCTAVCIVWVVVNDVVVEFEEDGRNVCLLESRMEPEQVCNENTSEQALVWSLLCLYAQATKLKDFSHPCRILLNRNSAAHLIHLYNEGVSRRSAFTNSHSPMR